ncbi:MAG: DUF3501 family protein [Acidobacteriota bacterium]
MFFRLPATGQVEAAFEAGHSSRQRISAVHYVRFRFSPSQREEFVRGAGPTRSLSSIPITRRAPRSATSSGGL